MRVPNCPYCRVPFSQRICSWLAALVVLTGLSAAQTVTFLDNFGLSTSVASPAGILAQGRDGNLYGTAGCCAYGTAFFKTDTSGLVSELHVFGGIGWVHAVGGHDLGN